MASSFPDSELRVTRRDDVKNIPLGRGFIQICVGWGSSTETFDVHENLLTSRSPFFKAALSGQWRESIDRMIRLPEDEPDVVRQYLHFLSTADLGTKSHTDSGRYHVLEECVGLVRLYVLAEKLQDTATKNRVMEEMVMIHRLHKNGRIPGQSYFVIHLIYAGTPPGSPMRRLIVNIFTERATTKWLPSDELTLPPEFLLELTRGLLDRRAKPVDPTSTDDATLYMESILAPGEALRPVPGPAIV
ncbi:hypothetical protein ACN47E_001500 [Coniothyrium glycines]